MKKYPYRRRLTSEIHPLLQQGPPDPIVGEVSLDKVEVSTDVRVQLVAVGLAVGINERQLHQDLSGPMNLSLVQVGSTDPPTRILGIASMSDD